MICPNCNLDNAPEATVCAGCNAPLSTVYVAPVIYDKKGFYKNVLDKKVKSNIIGGAIMAYISAAFILISALAASTDIIYSLIDVLLLVGLGLAVHIGKSRACAILLTIYVGISIVVTLVATGNFGGWLALVAAILSISGTFQYNKLWNQYKKENGIS